MSPSASVADALHDRLITFVTEDDGVTEGPVRIGELFWTVTCAEAVGPTPPSGSVGVTTTFQVSSNIVADFGIVELV